MNLTTQFLYHTANLSLYHPNIVHSAIAMVVFVVALVFARYVLLYFHGFFIVWREHRAIETKKWVLSDLILMKDIQSEMEKEIEQASLKATFQS